MKLIKNGTMLKADGTFIESIDILINDKKIINIAKEINAESDYEIIDANGQFVMPGIIDAHCHIGMWEDGIGFEGADGNEETDPVTPHLRALDSINPMDKCFKEAYENGVTTVCSGPGSANVIGGTFTIIKTKGIRIDNMVVKEPAALKVAFGENPKTTYHEKHEIPTTRMGIASVLRENLYKAMDYMKTKEIAQGDEDGEEAHHEFDLKLESIIPVLKRELPMKVHAHRADDIFTALRIAKEFNLRVTLDHCTEGHLIAEELAKEGFPAIVGPTLTDRSKVELRELDFSTAAVLTNAGLKVALMTDHPVIPVHYLPLCAALAVKAGLSEADALKAITINPAEILEVSDRVGSIEVGKDADIVIFDRHPLDVMAKTQKVFIDGELVFLRKNNK